MAQQVLVVPCGPASHPLSLLSSRSLGVLVVQMDPVVQLVLALLLVQLVPVLLEDHSHHEVLVLHEVLGCPRFSLGSLRTGFSRWSLRSRFTSRSWWAYWSWWSLFSLFSSWSRWSSWSTGSLKVRWWWFVTAILYLNARGISLDSVQFVQIKHISFTCKQDLVHTWLSRRSWWS